MAPLSALVIGLCYLCHALVDGVRGRLSPGPNGEGDQELAGSVHREQPVSHEESRRSWSLDALLGVAAPVSLLTALLAYFGYATTSAYFGYFGVGQNILDLSLQSYVFRSVAVTFGFGVRLVGVVALLVLADLVLGAVLRRRSSAVRTGTLRLVGVVGSLAALVGFYFVLDGPRPGWFPPLGPPMSLALGACLLLRWTLSRPRQRSTRSSLVVLSTVVVIASFWAATLYATAAGRESARTDDDARGRLPAVAVLSTEFLDIPGETISYSEITDAAGDHRHRYSGLRLLTYSNGRWFLLGSRYGPTYVSTVAVVRDSESINVEITDNRCADCRKP